MKTSELELPQYLYTESTGPRGAVDKLIAPDMLVSWAEQGRGDAIYRLCHRVYERRLAGINVWEIDRIQQLEEELMSAGYGEDMSACRYVTVKHYHTTLEDVVREAELNRVSVKERMTEHQTAIEELVKEAREFISALTVQQDEGDMLTYLFVIVAVVVAGYMFFF